MISSFKPLIYEDSNILILGSIPGEKSLQMQEYYAHPRNQFWRLLAAIYNEDVPQSYQDKISFLKSHQIAVWDTIDRCTRKGSLDSRIQGETLNSIEKLIELYPNIKHVFLNGSKAFQLFEKQLKDHPLDIPYSRLDSSSPAYTKRFDLKLKGWEQIIKIQRKINEGYIDGYEEAK